MADQCYTLKPGGGVGLDQETETDDLEKIFQKTKRKIHKIHLFSSIVSTNGWASCCFYHSASVSCNRSISQRILERANLFGIASNWMKISCS